MDAAAQEFSADLMPMLQKYLVKFKNFPSKQSVPLDYIRLTRDQVFLNQRKFEQIKNGEISGKGGADEEIGDLLIPDHLRMKRGDTEKVKLQKKKKVKALKFNHK